MAKFTINERKKRLGAPPALPPLRAPRDILGMTDAIRRGGGASRCFATVAARDRSVIEIAEISGLRNRP